MTDNETGKDVSEPEVVAERPGPQFMTPEILAVRPLDADRGAGNVFHAERMVDITAAGSAASSGARSST